MISHIAVGIPGFFQGLGSVVKCSKLCMLGSSLSSVSFSYFLD